MRTYFEYCFFVLFYSNLSFLLLSCQQPVTTDSNLKNNTDSKQGKELVSLNKQSVLTPTQIAAVFPEHLNKKKKTNIKLNPIENSATAFYDNNKYTIHVIDDLQHNFANLNIFNKRYQTKGQTEIEETIWTVRDGYKTIATIDDTGLTSISFVFKHRYLFTITGNTKQTPYMVWRFLELNKFQTLQ